MVVQQYYNVSFLDVVNSWNEEDVISWLRGLDDVVVPYLQHFTSSGINGRRLLLLTSVDLIDMGITNLHALRTFSNAIQLLINLCYEIDSENLQCIALQLSAKSRNLMHDLRCFVTPKGSKSFEWEVLSNSILSELSCLAEHTKKMVSWLDRSPFNADSSYHQIRDTILHLVVRIIQIIRSSCRNVGETTKNVQMLCAQLCTMCDRIVEESRDPLVLQTAYLENVIVKRSSLQDELGFNIEAPYKGMHIISEVKFRSPADFCGRLMAGDEIIQVNKRTVIGWQLNSISEMLLSCQSLEVSLLLKKRPCLHDGIVKSLTANIKYPTAVDAPPMLAIRPLKKRRRSSSLGVLHVSFAELALTNSSNNELGSETEQKANCILQNGRDVGLNLLAASNSFLKPFDRRRATFSVDELREVHSFALNSKVPLSKRQESFPLVEEASSTSDLSQLNLNLFIEQYNDCRRESCVAQREPFIWDQGIYAEVELADQASLIQQGIPIDCFSSPDWQSSSKNVQFCQEQSLENQNINGQMTDRDSKCLSEIENAGSLSAADVESPWTFNGQTTASDDECSSSMSMSFQSSCTTPVYPRSHGKLSKFFGESFDFPEARWCSENGDRPENCSAPVLSPLKVYAGVTLEGWAYQAKTDSRRSRHANHKWVKRWLVLKGFFLYVYLNNESYQPELVIRLSNCRVSPPGPELKTRKVNVFKVQDEDTNLYFRCDQRCEMLLWLKKLGLAAIGYAE
uniref:PH domain-containing protein n=1 Tax=Trichuris muris TaxID=70415 RepID=A0A5S6QN54_TRIMR